MTKESQNRLARESSPYLQQHAHNPVDWYPWGKEALDRARREQKPIFLSIGYSACHWCHVMERESFENVEIAALMNENFINIKVDREERQDLDHIYMSAVQVMTQHGGWPMSVFLTPDLEPFYGGTYFPPEDRMGMTGFKKILQGVTNAWTGRKEEVIKSAKQLVSALSGIADSESTAKSETALTTDLIDGSVAAMKRNFDTSFGGFGAAPKFFHTGDLRACLRHWKRSQDATSLGVVTVTLDHLRNGGIYDQLGGGFHRYSTDQKWLVPHFEKMLYDNALLGNTYLEAFQATGNKDYAHVARETLDYVLREMTSADGGFFSTQDADTEGVEGKFYVWTQDEIERILDKDLAAQLCRTFEVSQSGNWEGQNILHMKPAAGSSLPENWNEESLAAAKRKLLGARLKRSKPFRDEKIIMSWNGLMIEAMAKGYQVLQDERFLKTASQAADFILENLRSPAETPAGTALYFHGYKDGKSRLTAYLDDYACIANALVTLYESDFQPKWIDSAVDIVTTMLDQFWDDSHHAFYFTGRDHEKLITRPKEVHDGATPSATAMAVTALARLGKLTGNLEFSTKAYSVLQSHAPLIRSIPTATAQMIIGLEYLLSGGEEIVVAAGDSEEDTEGAIGLLRKEYLPAAVVALASGTPSKLMPALNDKVSVDKQVTVYFCKNSTCEAPIVGLERLKSYLSHRPKG